jgi:hypothetical protein
MKAILNKQDAEQVPSMVCTWISANDFLIAR